MKRFLALAVVLAVVGAASAQVTFGNYSSITINDSSPATPYPSTIAVSGLGANIISVTATLFNMNHTWPDDIDILLVGPTGANVLLLSDAGGSTDIVNVTVTFDDAAAGMIPDGGPMVSGTFKPSNYGTAQDPFPAPAPAGPYGSTFGGFVGTNGNGTWSLYVVDDLGGDTGSIAGGWELNITIPEPASLVLLALAGLIRRR